MVVTSNHKHPFASVCGAAMFKHRCILERFKIIENRTLRIAQRRNGLLHCSLRIFLEPLIQVGAFVNHLRTRFGRRPFYCNFYCIFYCNFWCRLSFAAWFYHIFYRTFRFGSRFYCIFTANLPRASSTCTVTVT